MKSLLLSLFLISTPLLAEASNLEKYLGCIQQIADQKIGGIEGQEFIVDTMIKIADAKGTDQKASQLLNECKDFKRDSIRAEEIDYTELAFHGSNYLRRKNTNYHNLISFIIRPKIRCSYKGIEIAAGYQAGAGLNIAIGRCYTSHGKVYRSITPGAALYAGTGVIVGVFEGDSYPVDFTDRFGSGGNIMPMLTAGLGRAGSGEIAEGSRHDGRGIGVGVMGGVAVSKNIRLKAKKNNFSMLIKYIKNPPARWFYHFG